MFRLYPITASLLAGVTLWCWGLDIVRGSYTDHALLYLSVLVLAGVFFRSKLVVGNHEVRVTTPFMHQYTLKIDNNQKWYIGSTYLTVTKTSGQAIKIRFERGRAQFIKQKLSALPAVSQQ